MTSRAMPLLYLNEVAQMRSGIGTRRRDRSAHHATPSPIVLSKQTSAGCFGLWGAYSWTDLWLDSCVTEFLLRAKDKGFAVPEQAMTMALDNLSNQLSLRHRLRQGGGEDIAYALYDLARAGRAAIGDLRYYFEARLDRFGTPLAKAQLGAALALYGDRTRASAGLPGGRRCARHQASDRASYRRDYGSQLRDTAAVLALPPSSSPRASTSRRSPAGLRDLRDVGPLDLDAGRCLDAHRRLGPRPQCRRRQHHRRRRSSSAAPSIAATLQEEFDDGPVTIANNGNKATEVKISVTGIPTRRRRRATMASRSSAVYYNLDGDAKLTCPTSRQNDRFVVVLTMTPTHLGSGQYLVADPLPAGLRDREPGPDRRAAAVGDLELDQRHIRRAMSNRGPTSTSPPSATVGASSFSTAYVVRATSPGTFVLPGATVEDMYRPELRGNTDLPVLSRSRPPGQ